MIGEDMWKEHHPCLQRPSVRSAASAFPMSSPQVADDRSLLGRQSFLASPRVNAGRPSRAALETVRASTFQQSQHHRRDSVSNIRRTSRSPSRPSTMRGRQSFSSSVNQPEAESLFIDTSYDPGNLFEFPSSKIDSRPQDVEESRPVSNEGAISSFQTAMCDSANHASQQVEFGRPLPQGYQKIPAYAIGLTERDDACGLGSASLPTLPDSPIAFPVHMGLQDEESSARRPQEHGPSASKWSTNIQTNAQEVQEQENLVDDPLKEKRRENFAVRGCHKIARALSNRIGSDSLPERLRSRRWKSGKPERATPMNETDDDSLVLSARQGNLETAK